MIDPGLTGKVVLVTGANNPHGIGAAVAQACAAQGAKVFLHFFRWFNKLQNDSSDAGSPGVPFYAAQQGKTADEILEKVRALGVQASAFEADLADASVIAEVFDRAEKELGPVDVLVNNAAHWEADTFVPPEKELANPAVELWTDRPAPFDAQRFDRLFAVDCRAPAQLMAEFARRHVARGATWGRIINVSTAGARVFPSEISYGASKYALESYTRSAAVELGKFGITVNVVSLGPIQTGWINAALEKYVLPTIPLGRIGQPRDVGDAIVFLASEQARWITGQLIFVGGGHGM